MERYEYDWLYDNLEDILLHPENHENIVETMKKVFIDSESKQSWEYILAGLVNNHYLEKWLIEASRGELKPQNPTFEYLEMRRGNSDFDFDNGWEAKHYKDSTGGFNWLLHVRDWMRSGCPKWKRVWVNDYGYNQFISEKTKYAKGVIVVVYNPRYEERPDKLPVMWMNFEDFAIYSTYLPITDTFKWKSPQKILYNKEELRK